MSQHSGFNSARHNRECAPHGHSSHALPPIDLLVLWPHAAERQAVAVERRAVAVERRVMAMERRAEAVELLGKTESVRPCRAVAGAT
eukprot:scaffold6939_cov28-Tisochrysis_lutea.AAC.1